MAQHAVHVSGEAVARLAPVDDENAAARTAEHQRGAEACAAAAHDDDIPFGSVHASTMSGRCVVTARGVYDAADATPREGEAVPEVVLAHDYLVQVGGAERVVAEWAAGFRSHTVVTLAYRAEATFDEFRQLDVRATIPRRLATQVERMLPMLPSIAARTTVSGGDVALVSSSGWAHRFRFEIPHVVYVHSPARWLYAADDYRMRLSPIRRAGLAMSTPLLRRGDLDAMERAHAIVSNSEVTRDRMRAVYGLDSIVVHPPVEPVAIEARRPARELPDEFVVVVARNRGYKNVTLAVAAAQAARMPIVIVGSGSDRLDAPDEGVYGLGSRDGCRAVLGVSRGIRHRRRRARGFRPLRARGGARGNPGGDRRRGRLPRDRAIRG